MRITTVLRCAALQPSVVRPSPLLLSSSPQRLVPHKFSDAIFIFSTRAPSLQAESPAYIFPIIVFQVVEEEGLSLDFKIAMSPRSLCSLLANLTLYSVCSGRLHEVQLANEFYMLGKLMHTPNLYL
jgi:hypothetical protein